MRAVPGVVLLFAVGTMAVAFTTSPSLPLALESTNPDDSSAPLSESTFSDVKFGNVINSEAFDESPHLCSSTEISDDEMCDKLSIWNADEFDRGEPEEVAIVSPPQFHDLMLNEETPEEFENLIQDAKKRAFNSWGGKRTLSFNSWGGKRAFNSWGGKRAFNSWGGKRQTAFNSWGGKRAPAFNSWGGKRAFNSWGGKRAPAFNSWDGKRVPAFNSWGGKRAFNSWGGKRAPAFNSWGGKRAFNSWGGKRAFNSWGGKRAFNSWGGKRQTAFNSWGGKRAPALNSLDGKRAPAFNSWGGKRAFNSWEGQRVPEMNGRNEKSGPVMDTVDSKTNNSPQENTFRHKRELQSKDKDTLEDKNAPAFSSIRSEKRSINDTLKSTSDEADSLTREKRGTQSGFFRSVLGKNKANRIDWQDKRNHHQAFNSWGGKRSSEDHPESSSETSDETSSSSSSSSEEDYSADNSMESDNSIPVAKRLFSVAAPRWSYRDYKRLGGQRILFNPWGGKRSDPEWSVGEQKAAEPHRARTKRARDYALRPMRKNRRGPDFYAWGGKRSDSEFRP